MRSSSSSNIYATTCICVLLALNAHNCFASQSSALSSSRAPIVLNLKRVTVNETGLIKLPKGEVRSKSQLFLKTLGIEAGKPFNFDMDKWKAIQRSGLFRNLTAKAVTVESGEVVLRITGQELPSIRFSPEVSVAASLDRPEVSGGVSFSDRNFRGLAQRFDFQITKKEGKEVGTDDLHPTIVAKWTDNKIGKSSSIIVGYEEESRFEDGADILPVMRLPRYMQLGIRARNRSETKIRKSFVRFKENHDRNESLNRTSNSLGCQMDVEVEPYRTLLGDEFSVSELQGAKISANWHWKEGFSASASHDGGVGIFSCGKSLYRQLSGDVSTPLVRILSAFEGTVKSTVTSSEEGAVSLISPLEDSELSKIPLQLLGRFKASGMSSWGGACLPLFHQIPLGDSLTVRSYADIPGPDYLDLFGSHKKRTSAFVAMKADVYLDGLGSFTPGAFLDAALLKSLAVSDDSQPTSYLETALGVGLSLRAFGFRIDTAWPVGVGKSSPRVHLGVDIGA